MFVGKRNQDGSMTETKTAKLTDMISRGRGSRFLNNLLAIDTGTNHSKVNMSSSLI